MISGTNINSSPHKVLRIQPVVRLRPKRRFKIDPELVREEVVDLPVPIPVFPRRPRMKRSGQPHQQWKPPAELCPATPKLRIAPMLHEVVELVTRTSLRLAHSYHSHYSNFRHATTGDQSFQHIGRQATLHQTPGAAYKKMVRRHGTGQARWSVGEAGAENGRKNSSKNIKSVGEAST